MRTLILCCAVLTIAAGAVPAEAQAPTVLLKAPEPEIGVPVSLAVLAERLQPAVVSIAIRQTVISRAGPGGEDAGDPPSSQRVGAEGSGFIVSPDGYVVTNNHVVAPAGANARVDRITLTLSDRRELPARVVGTDKASDLAVLKVDGAANLPFVRFGDSTRTRVGDWVMAVGNPFGIGISVSAGIVSGLHRNLNAGLYDRYIQTDASINRGNSGGPMFDLKGDVIGVNTIIISPSGASVGVGFAVPSEQARPVVEALMRGARPQRGYLGVAPQAIDNDNLADAVGIAKHSGELVKMVTAQGPAHLAGIVQGDIITRVNGLPVTGEDRLTYLASLLPIGRRVPIEVVRGGQRRIVDIAIGDVPTDEEQAKLQFIEAPVPARALAQPASATPLRSPRESLGLTLQALTPEVATSMNITSPNLRGVVVSAVDPSAEGIRRRDIILSIDQVPVETPDQVAAMVEAARGAGRTSILLLVKRGRAQSTTTYVGMRIL